MCSELLRIGPLASMLKRIQISIRKQFPEFISIIHFQNPFPTSYPKTLEAAGGHWKPVEATKQLELISHWRPPEVGCHLLGFWLPLACHLAAHACQLAAPCLPFDYTWPPLLPLACHLAATCLPFGCHLAATWLALACMWLLATWLSLACHLASFGCHSVYVPAI